MQPQLPTHSAFEKRLKEVEKDLVAARCIDSHEAKWKELITGTRRHLCIARDLPYPIFYTPRTLNDVNLKSVHDFLTHHSAIRDQRVGEELQQYEAAVLRLVRLRVAMEIERWKAENVARFLTRFPSIEQTVVLKVAERVRKVLSQVEVKLDRTIIVYE